MQVKDRLPVEMERVESSIPVVNGNLNVLHVLVSIRVGLGTVNLRQEGVVTHRKRREDGRDHGRSVSDIIVRSTVGSIIVSVEENVQSVLNVRRRLFKLEDGHKLGVVDDWVFGEFDRGSGSVALSVDDLEGVVEDERLWDSVVHVFGLENRESIVGAGLILGLDQDRVSLSDGNGEQAKFPFVDVVRGDLDTICLDQEDLVLVPVDVEH